MASKSSLLDDLTQRQHDVLKLLSEHMTSKEIARELGISHYTVDQHVAGAAAKLGTTNRRELALVYRRLQQAPEGLGPQETGVASTPPLSELECGADVVASADLDEKPSIAYIDHRVIPEMYDGPYRTYIRLGAIIVATLVLLFVALVSMAVFTEASRFVQSIF